MNRRLVTYSILLTINMVFSLYAQEDTSAPAHSLLWDTFNESKTYFQDITDYSCSVEHKLPNDAGSPIIAEFRVSYVQPAQYYLSFDDNEGKQQEFIFIEGTTHRQFVYPKQYRISSDGSLLYSGELKGVISIPANSMDLYYKYIIPACQSNRDNLQWSFRESELINDQRTITFTVTFTQPISIENIPFDDEQHRLIKSIHLTLDENNSQPLKIVLSDADGVFDIIKYNNLQINTGLDTTFFDNKIAQKKYEKDTQIDRILTVNEDNLKNPDYLKTVALELAKLSLERYAKIDDYSATFSRQERMNNKLQKPETFIVKFRKPFDVYMKWIDGANKGWELLYARGKYNNKVVVHVSGLANLFMPTLTLDPTGSLAMMNNRHSILEFGLGYTIENYYRDLKNSIAKNEIELTYHGIKKVDNKPCWVIEAKLPPLSKEYYCYRSVLYFDKELFLPIKMLFYEWNKADNKEYLIEDYTYHNLKFNNNFTDKDFDRKNKEYGF